MVALISNVFDFICKKCNLITIEKFAFHYINRRRKKIILIFQKIPFLITARN